MKLVDLIPVGAENAIPKSELIKITGLSDRALRLQVSHERRAGYPILTDCTNSGYYLPENEADAVRFVRSMRKRARETAAIADAVERTMAHSAEQEIMEGF